MMGDAPAPTRRHLLAGALTCGALALAPGRAMAQTARIALDTLLKGNTQGGSVEINGVTESRGRVTFSVTLSLPAYFFNLDRYGSTRGNFGSGDLQLFWKGKTFGGSGDARGIDARTLVHAEEWLIQDLLFDKVRRRVTSRTYSVDLRFEPRWNRETGQIRLELARLSIPDADPVVERAVRSMVNWYTSDTALVLGNLDRLTPLSPVIAETRFEVAGRGSGFDCHIRMSVDATALRRIAAERGIRDLQDERLWHALIAEAIGG